MAATTSASLRNGRNHISKIEQNGRILVSLNGIKEGTINYFLTLFAKPKSRRIEMGGLGFSKISKSRSVSLAYLR